MKINLLELTVPVNAKNPDLAADFVRYMLGERGRSIFEKHYQPLIYPQDLID